MYVCTLLHVYCVYVCTLLHVYCVYVFTLLHVYCVYINCRMQDGYFRTGDVAEKQGEQYFIIDR